MIIFPENSLIRTISTHKYRYFPKKSPRKQDIFIKNRHRFKIFPQKAPQIRYIFIKNHIDTRYFPKPIKKPIVSEPQNFSQGNL